MSLTKLRLELIEAACECLEVLAGAQVIGVLVLEEDGSITPRCGLQPWDTPQGVADMVGVNVWNAPKPL